MHHRDGADEDADAEEARATARPERMLGRVDAQRQPDETDACHATDKAGRDGDREKRADRAGEGARQKGSRHRGDHSVDYRGDADPGACEGHCLVLCGEGEGWRGTLVTTPHL
ncbi:hypothetical protein Pa4123_13490 [Phytohabitans aurantiacus]|uniref:Uncharacterized protein n=1 Tax=Phytohabitans aurantiacus TaxID=3016789 RepID=A0ABQ5QQA0_9ACTN|nr:hypothetical protein Pa4123_13490 [Phytohabitans aurantiacus]